MNRWALLATALVGLGTGTPVASAPLPTGLATQTTTTSYTYNADGALTSLTTQVDGEPATTTYVSWDNFTPSVTDPATGTVSAANGNLLGYGPSPGAVALEAEFAFDVRDRLIGYASATGQSVSYAYHPTSILASSTLPSGDALLFYYDTSVHPQVSNVVQTSSGLTSSFLAGRESRYLSDGTEQFLLCPRKDIAGLYDAASGTFTSYGFDPYGAPLGATDGVTPPPAAPDYDMAQNPFQYTREFKDPLWGGYYLRARWYAPDLQVFLSRDPRPNLNRYGYTDGNPVMRADPSGMGYQHTMQPLNTFLNKDLGGEGHGALGEVWGGVARVVLAPVIGPLQLVATPETFWHTATHSKRQAIMLSAGVATEIATAPFPSVSFGAHLAIDAIFGLGQSTLTAFSHNFEQFRGAAFVHGLELTASGMFYGRYLAGAGYQPYNLTAEDVDKLITTHFQSSDDPLVFRMREPRADYNFLTKPYYNNTSPYLEQLDRGFYNESIIAIVDPERAYLTEVTTRFIEGRYEVPGMFSTYIPYSGTVSYVSSTQLPIFGNLSQDLGDFDRGIGTRFQRLDVSPTDARTQILTGNPRGFPTRDEISSVLRGNGPQPTTLQGINNCHLHATGMISSLR